MNNSKTLVFKRDLETVKLDDDVTLGGRLFHTCTAVTGKARPPMVAQQARRIDFRGEQFANF